MPAESLIKMNVPWTAVARTNIKMYGFFYGHFTRFLYDFVRDYRLYDILGINLLDHSVLLGLDLTFEHASGLREFYTEYYHYRIKRVVDTQYDIHV